ncbi:MAG: cation diffusion facilitator family transporter [Bacteroidales bacterium]
MQTRVAIAKRVTVIGLFVNLFLGIIKGAAAVVGRSSAMLADAIHTLSDLITDFVVLFFISYSGKECDEDHRYGHGKFETFATLIISFALMVVAIGIIWSGGSVIYKSLSGDTISKPGIVAFWAALISIVAKEILYRYTIKNGKIIKSETLIANGWHHRTDALSSIGTLLGIGGAIFLGERWRILDPIAAIVVSILILKVAIDLAIPSIKELLESSLPKEVVGEIEEILEKHPDVISFDHLRSRKIGIIYAIDVHIKIDREVTFERSHEITEELDKEIKERFGEETIVLIHAEPK